MVGEIAHNDFKNLKRKYISVFGLIFIFTALAQAFIQISIHFQKKDGKAINIAGRQRMLSQRISKLAILSLSDETHREDLRKNLKLFAESHQNLMKGNEELGLAKPVLEDVIKGYEMITPLLDDLKEHSLCILEKCPTVKESFQALNQSSDLFLFQMNAQVNLLEQKNSDKIFLLSISEYVIFTVIVLVMIYEVFFVLIPYQRRIDEERAFLLQTSKLASLGEMSAGIAHEINNPLAIISSSLQLIGRNHTDKDKLERSLDKANRSIDRIAKIISGLKKFSRKSNKLEIESYSLKTLIEESVELASAKSNRHKVDVLYGEMEDFQVDCDEIQFSQVLTNLIGNGIDAVSGNENPWVKVSYRVLEDFVQIRIQDSGKGIKAQTVAKLFDPFFTTKNIGKGTGLGLSISKGIIESHGGSLDYELFEGHTSFLITLSRKNSAQAA